MVAEYWGLPSLSMQQICRLAWRCILDFAYDLFLPPCSELPHILKFFDVKSIIFVV